MKFRKLSRIKVYRSRNLKKNMPQLKIGDLVAKIPIVQGGMGVGISLAGLASAVANEGGIGVIAANAIGMLEKDYFTNGKEANKRAFRKEIRKARTLTNGVIGVNIMVAVNDFHDLLKIAVEEKVDIVFMGAGLPLKGIPIDEIKAAGVKVAPIVSSARAAALIFRYWEKNYDTVPDALVVEGPEAGGHLGFKVEQLDDPAYSLEKLVPEVVAEISYFEEKHRRTIPVIAAGGIYTGEDIYKFFKLGAGGVQMATRFVATHQCDADSRFKEAYIHSRKEDISIIKSPVGMPGRAIKNDFLKAVESGERNKIRCPWRCLESCDAKHSQYCISQALDNARQGKLDKGFAFAGSNAYRVEEIVPVKALMKELQQGYLLTVERCTESLRKEFEESLRRLIVTRNRYVKAAKKSVRSLKVELGEILEKGTIAFQEEWKHAMNRLESLKNEYAEHFNRVNELKEQLSRFFDTSALKIPHKRRLLKLYISLPGAVKA